MLQSKNFKRYQATRQRKGGKKWEVVDYRNACAVVVPNIETRESARLKAIALNVANWQNETVLDGLAKV